MVQGYLIEEWAIKYYLIGKKYNILLENRDYNV
jgi:hypothetical protein